MDEVYSPLETVPNFRDIGRYVNEQLGSERMKTGLFYRGARPDDASPLDREKLTQEYGLKSMVDLRTKTEKIEQAQKRDASIKASAAIPQTEDQVAEPLKIPGITYHEINFNGSAFSRQMMAGLSWYDYFKLIVLMLLGYRWQAIKLLKPSLEKKGLEGLATDSLDACTKEVRQFFEVMAEPSNYPVMVHCTQGKDRTGLTVLLVLFLLGIPPDVVDADYMLSDTELFVNGQKRIKDISKLELSTKFGRCSPRLVRRVEEHLKEKFGSVVGYLDHCGVDEEMRKTVIEKLLKEEFQPAALAKSAAEKGKKPYRDADSSWSLQSLFGKF